MNAPISMKPVVVTKDTEILASYTPIPGFGILPVNAFLIRAQEPVLIDAGLSALTTEFMDNLRSRIPLESLRWIWLTHTDADHIGSLENLLHEAPNARVVTTYLGMGKLGLHRPVPPQRVFLLNPGQALDVGDRSLVAGRPAVFDAPETTTVFDKKSGILFSSDCFGALLGEPASSAEEIPTETLRQGMVTWATVDAPWLHALSREAFAPALARLRAEEPSAILSSHLPPARGVTDSLLRNLDAAREAEPFVGPDQAAVEAMLAAA